MDYNSGKKYSMEDLLSIMEKLRAPDGCPWDREQTHRSLRKCFIEETYEDLEAIDTDDTELLKEELGDVLFQVVFHSELEREKGSFDFSDVVDGVARKMVLRHPHVFGKTEVRGTEDVLKNWDAIKKETKGQNTQKEVLESVSKVLPALMRSAKVLKKAEKAGWKESYEERTEELFLCSEAFKTGKLKPEEAERRMGDLLLAAVSLSNFWDVDPEEALSRACDGYIEAFGRAEETADREKIPLKEALKTCAGKKDV